MNIVANFPAKSVFSSSHCVIPLDREGAGDSLMSSVTVTIKEFKGDRYTWLRDFTVGWDSKDGYWAFGNGATVTSHPQDKKYTAGYELGDEITIDGKVFIIREAPNHNIKFESEAV